MIKRSSVQYTSGDDYHDADVYIICESGEEWKRQVTKYLGDGHVSCGDFEYAMGRLSDWQELRHDELIPVEVIPVEVVAAFDRHVNAIYARFGASPIRYWAGKYSTGEINGSPETCC